MAERQRSLLHGHIEITMAETNERGRATVLWQDTYLH